MSNVSDETAPCQSPSAQPSTVPLTPEQIRKIKELIQRMERHYNPLPPQLLTYRRMMSTSSSPIAQAQTTSHSRSQTTTLDDGSDAARSTGATPRHPEHDAVWFYCGCFLMSREWDVEKAFAMMQEVVAYRAANHLDEQSFFPPAVPVQGWTTEEICAARGGQSPRPVGQRADRVCAGVAQGIACGVHYWDRGGRPVVYIMINSLDERELVRQLKEMAAVGQSPVDVVWEFAQHFLGVCESLVLHQMQQRAVQHASRRSSALTAAAAPTSASPATAPGLSHGVITLVVDLQGLSLKMLWKPMLDIFRDVAKEFFKYYPDAVHRILCVNSPSIVRYAFRLVRGVMPVTFQRKITFVGAHDTLTTLEAVIERQHIPHFLGGDCRCAAAEGEGCVAGYDPEHPRRADRRHGHANCTAADDGARTEDVTLSAGHECTRVFPIKAAETVAWEFAVSGGGLDITFTTYFVPEAAASAMRWTRVDTKKLSDHVVHSEALADGADGFAAAEDGVVVLGWRNTRSWFASKRLQLRAYKDTASS